MPSAKRTLNMDLNYWEGNEYVKRADFCDDNLKIDSYCGKLKETSTPVITETVMSASKWQGNKYSFEADYPSELYNITIEAGGDLCTKEEMKAFSKRMIKGDADINVYKAMNVAPEIDIHIILTVVKKFVEKEVI